MSGQPISQESEHILTGGQSEAVTVSTTTAQSAAYTGVKSFVLNTTIACFIRQGEDPTALSDGTDQYIPASVPMRFVGFTSGNKIAVIGTGDGVLYITPEY